VVREGAAAGLGRQHGTVGAERVFSAGWLVTAGIIVGVCSWAAIVCVAMGMAGATRVPLGGAALALFVSIGATIIAFAGGLSRKLRIAGPRRQALRC